MPGVCRVGKENPEGARRSAFGVFNFPMPGAFFAEIKEIKEMATPRGHQLIGLSLFFARVRARLCVFPKKSFTSFTFEANIHRICPLNREGNVKDVKEMAKM